jgi:Zn-dependent peptidase ImmA (M78 family)
MNLDQIRYGRKIIKIEYKKLKKYDGYFETKKELLVIDKTIKGVKLFNTIIHELFHLIMHFEKINVNHKGEETIAIAVGNGFTKIFKQNPKLFKKLTKLI